MLNAIIDFSVKKKLIIILFVLGLVVYGGFQTTKLSIDAVPDITNNQIQIITTAPALGATDIERLITAPLEQNMANISGIVEMRSFSRFGLSLLTVVFTDNTDVYWARQQVSERLLKIQNIIPKSIGTPELGPITTGLGEIYQYTIRPKKGFETKYDITQLRTIQDWIVRKQLLNVKGVAEVSSFGGKLKQYEIALNANKLNALQLSIADVFKAVEQNNQNTGGSYIEKGNNAIFIRTNGLLSSISDMEQIVIKQTGDKHLPILLKDVATVEIGFATRYGAMVYNNEGEAAGGIVMMLKGENSNNVIKQVKDRVEAINKTLPEGLYIDAFLDRTKMVNTAISTVTKNLLEGALIVIFILVLFLGNLRAGFIVASIIPLSMLFAICMMNFFGVSGNLMSLGALDFGLIVDGAVIIVEAVMHQIAHSSKFKKINVLSQEQMDKAVTTTAHKMMSSSVFGQIVILIVYLPIFTLQGIEGKMFKPMAQTVAFALLGAFILSITYVPMVTSLWLGKKPSKLSEFSDRIMEKLQRGYTNSLLLALRWAKPIVLAVIAVFIGSVVTIVNMGGEFIPSLEEGDFAVETRVLKGSSLNTSIDYVQKAAGILKAKFPEVEKVVGKIGSGEVPTDPMPIEAADMMVILKPKSEWTSAKTFNELSDKMTEALADIPGLFVGFQYPVQMRFNELMTGAKQDVVCKIFGENLDTLSKYANQLGKISSGVQGAEELYVEAVTGLPEVLITYNRTQLSRFNVDVETVNNTVNTAFAGQQAGIMYEDEKRFNIVVRLDKQERKTVEQLQNLLIPTGSGGQVPLNQLAEVQIKEGPNQIQREDAKRRIIVGFNVKNRDVQSVVNDLKIKVEQQVKLPAGYYITYGGSFENLIKAKNRLLIAVPIALLLIFIMLYFAFKSVRLGLLIFTAIPLSAIGGILFLALRGMPFSISAGVGFIALFGVAVLNGIVLIAQFIQLKQQGVHNIMLIVVRGTMIRLRPVLMTALVASLGFLPMALSSGSGAEVQKPLATVVIGGLLIATFLTLYVLPILYVVVYKKSMEKHHKMKLSKTVHMVIAIISLTATKSLQAQQPISLQQAVDTAYKHNVGLKIAANQSLFSKQMMQANTAVKNTDIGVEAGQINSAYFDTKLLLSQNFSLPQAVVAEKQQWLQQWKLSLVNEQLDKLKLSKYIAELYYDYLHEYQKIKVLKQIDDLYVTAVNKAITRFKAGEVSQLEQAYLNTNKYNNELQLQNGYINLSVIQYKFNYLLQSIMVQYVPDTASGFKAWLQNLPDTTLLMQHPQIKYAQQLQQIAAASTQLLKAERLPQLSVGYANGSIRGTGADEKNYTAINRFHSMQVGVNMPLFQKSYKAKLAASKIKEQEAALQTYVAQQNLLSAYNTYNASIQKGLQQTQWLESKVLPNVQAIVQVATKQYLLGEIDYINYANHLTQYLTTQLNYATTIQQLNTAIINYNYLISK